MMFTKYSINCTLKILLMVNYKFIIPLLLFLLFCAPPENDKRISKKYDALYCATLLCEIIIPIVLVVMHIM